MSDPVAERFVTLPLFPLGTVLFPGGLLPLRVFEARYVDMVRRAMREGGEFGVCLIRQGAEVGAATVEIEPIGCSARIGDWNMEQLGVLEIMTTGTRRFRIHDRTLQPDGLWVGSVEQVDDDPVVAPLPEAAHSVAVLERIVAQFDAPPEDAARPVRSPISAPYRFDDAGWVANRLSELLPIPLPLKQRLMAMTDPHERLSVIGSFLVESPEA